jgi:hypothetical protein
MADIPQGEKIMSETTTSEETVNEPEVNIDENTDTQNSGTEETVDTTAAGQKETDWKAEARKWETRAKSDFDAANKWREYENSLKPEQERVQEELAAVKAEAEAAKIALMRYEVATSKNLSSDALDLLTGNTKEELEAKADALLSLIDKSVKPKVQPNPEQGKPVNSTDQILSREVLATMSAKEIMEAKKEGRLDTLLGN